MFQDFVVLGIIPGTNFQISFQLWLLGIITAATAYYVLTHKAEVRMNLMILRIRLAIVTRQFDVR
jgi:hypothetical protein